MTQQLCLTVVRSDESENFTKATQLSLLSSLKPLVFKCSELLERSGALLLHNREYILDSRGRYRQNFHRLQGRQNGSNGVSRNARSLRRSRYVNMCPLLFDLAVFSKRRHGRSVAAGSTKELWNRRSWLAASSCNFVKCVTGRALLQKVVIDVYEGQEPVVVMVVVNSGT